MILVVHIEVEEATKIFLNDSSCFTGGITSELIKSLG